ncbi:uncharacterized protein BJ212DRAFT_956867 [Suillus subaureus]|uniref:Uncharacterized protein n=1 Tax=Suillus subaureus TaxID=48587 RepID=A0A9P7DUK8_9AGAM|nr:uncharacterized protein BJ212DRAFT_956867 [Suillus subaureus]KAG1803388.1 hypothetical protein BJ212DRAFT_956867 [Suillus subaureus]
MMSFQVRSPSELLRFLYHPTILFVVIGPASVITSIHAATLEQSIGHVYGMLSSLNTALIGKRFPSFRNMVTDSIPADHIIV